MIPNQQYAHQMANQQYMQQTAAMPDYYQQNLMSPNQAEINKLAGSENAQKNQFHCCVDLSHMHDFHYMHDFHHMHDYHHMYDFHPMDHYHPMHDFHPAMHESWDPHEGWDFTSIDYHHESFHPYDYPHPMHHMPHMHHMPYMHHPICFPVVCSPADKGEQGQQR